MASPNELQSIEWMLRLSIGRQLDPCQSEGFRETARLGDTSHHLYITSIDLHTDKETQEPEHVTHPCPA